MVFLLFELLCWTNLHEIATLPGPSSPQKKKEVLNPPTHLPIFSVQTDFLLAGNPTFLQIGASVSGKEYRDRLEIIGPIFRGIEL